MAEVVYAPRGRYRDGHLAAENGQGMGWSDTCEKFECQKWESGVAVAPLLQPLKGFWCCPGCRASYGSVDADWTPDPPESTAPQADPQEGGAGPSF